jgi:lipoprotein-anchoring transpeptidase ErfK/SrfK
MFKSRVLDSAHEDETTNTAVRLSRRAVMVGLPLALGGCVTADYSSVRDGDFVVPAAPMVDGSLARTEVSWTGRERPGSIVVNIAQRRLYLVQANGRAIRYGVGVGRTEAANFRGNATIGRKEKWPHWTPTATMIAAIPRYRAYRGGMNGGLENPLGARALYLYRDGHDTFFRLHGTNEPDSIGQAVSSGCVRLLNQDIIDLYNRVPVGAHVTVLQG